MRISCDAPRSIRGDEMYVGQDLISDRIDALKLRNGRALIDGDNVRMKTIRWIVSGRVQGVGYRFFARKTATRLGIAGTARNLMDGTVEILACGEEPVLTEFYAELLKGPSFSDVSNIEMYEIHDEFVQFEDFSILYK